MELQTRRAIHLPNARSIPD